MSTQIKSKNIVYFSKHLIYHEMDTGNLIHFFSLFIQVMVCFVSTMTILTRDVYTGTMNNSHYVCAKYILLLSVCLISYVMINYVNGHNLTSDMSGGITRFDNSEVNDQLSKQIEDSDFNENNTEIRKNTISIDNAGDAMDDQDTGVSNLTDSQTTRPFASQTGQNPTKNTTKASLIGPSLYWGIVSNFPIFATEYELRDRSCNGRCGISLECSCKPICIFLGTCCWDFRKACENVYNLTQAEEEYQWLEDVDTECVSDSVVVSSCSPYKMISEGLIQDTSLMQTSSLLDDSSLLYLQRETTTSSRDDQFTRMKFFNFLWMLSRTEKKNFRAAEETLLNVPILDNSTGISYKNVSVYLCNGANISHALWWLTLLQVTDADIKTLSVHYRTNLLYIFDLSNSVKTCSIFPTTRYIHLRDVERCDSRAVQSCPGGFLDYEVSKACKDVAFMIKTEMETDRTATIFKNPFCLYCNKDNIQGRMSAHVKDLLIRVMCHESGIIWYVQEKNGSISLLIKNAVNPSQLMPNWRKLSCRLISSKDSNSVQSIESNKSDSHTEQISPTNVLKLDCHIEECLYSVPELECKDKCVFILALPEGVYKINDLHMARLQSTWIQFLFEK